MSTYAAVFLENPFTKDFCGFSVKWDGYIKGGVGETLLNHYSTPDSIKPLCFNNKTDVRCLGDTIEETEYYTDENPGRYNRFKRLSFEQMMNEGGNYDYLYVMKFDPDFQYEWQVRLPSGKDLISLQRIIEDQEIEA